MAEKERLGLVDPMVVLAEEIVRISDESASRRSDGDAGSAAAAAAAGKWRTAGTGRSSGRSFAATAAAFS